VSSTGKKISIQLTQEQLDALGRAFATSPEGELAEAELESLIKIAVNSWIKTILGPSRYRTISELFISWLRDIYVEHLKKEYPSEKRLSTRLGFPYGQATYLCRVLSADQPFELRKKALSELLDKIGQQKAKAKEWIKKDRGDERIKITLSKPARRELDTILSSLVESNTSVQPARTEGSMRDYVTVLIVAGDLESIEKEVFRTQSPSK
jgi:hypothetical protein